MLWLCTISDTMVNQHNVVLWRVTTDTWQVFTCITKRKMREKTLKQKETNTVLMIK